MHNHAERERHFDPAADFIVLKQVHLPGEKLGPGSPFPKEKVPPRLLRALFMQRKIELKEPPQELAQRQTWRDAQSVPAKVGRPKRAAKARTERPARPPRLPKIETGYAIKHAGRGKFVITIDGRRNGDEPMSKADAQARLAALQNA